MTEDDWSYARRMAPDADLSLARAVWVDPRLVVVPHEWTVHAPGASWSLVSSPTGSIALSGHHLVGDDLERVPLAPDLHGRWAADRLPHLAHHVRLRAEGPLAVPDLLTRQLALVGTVGGHVRYATSLQIAPVIDVVFGARARERVLGPVFGRRGIDLRVWAPTAAHVQVHVWQPDSPDAEAVVLPMRRDDDGTWSASLPTGMRDGTYLYEVTAPRPGRPGRETALVTDPYSTGLTLNSRRSVLTDLGDPHWSPPGFTSSAGPPLAQLVDATVYELHVRDFSWSDPLVHPAHRGTYLAFADDGLGRRHLAALADAGLNTVHLLPCFDFASVNDDVAAQVHPTGLTDQPPDSPRQQETVRACADADGFNWGYDPLHWGVPEGAYASCSTAAHGGTRVREFRQMVTALHDLGLRVVLDQVFTHTVASGPDPRAVLDRVVPGYYHRLDALGRVCDSTCCSNVATEHVMAEKIMVDLVVRWARDYRVDGFRFDLMGHSSAANMLAVREALDALVPERDGIDGRQIYLYGEGWNFGEVADNARFVQATQGQVHGARIATFTDRLRDAVRGGRPTDEDPTGTGFASGLAEHPGVRLAHATDLLQLGLAGNLADFSFRSARGHRTSGAHLVYEGQPAGYAVEPWDVITYVDAHDNETLWDALTYKLPRDLAMSDRVRLNTLALACATLAQTPVLWHAGSDLLRSKSLDRNSFDSGDWFNRLDWSGADNGFGHGLPPAPENGARWPLAARLLADPALKPDADDVRFAAACAADLLRIRFSSPLFRLGEAAAIRSKVGFPASGTPLQLPGVVAEVIDDTVGEPRDPERDGVLVVLNATGSGVRQHLPGLAGRDLTLHRVQAAGADPVVRSASWNGDTATVPGRTVAVFDILAASGAGVTPGRRPPRPRG